MKTFVILMLYMVLLHVIPLLNVLGVTPEGRIYVAIDVATLVPAFMGLLYLIRRPYSPRHQLTKLDLMVLLYAMWSLASIVLYYLPNAPTEVEAYLFGIHLFVLPMSMYFAAKLIPPHLQSYFILGVVALNLFAFGFGLYAYYVRPAYYTAYLLNSTFGERNITNDWQIYGRLQSYLGSTAVATTCAVTIGLLTLARGGRFLMTLALPVIMLAVTLSRQRGGMVASAIALIAIIFLNKRQLVLKLVAVFVALPALAFAINYLDEAKAGVRESLIERATTELAPDELFSVAYGEGQYRGYGPGFIYITEHPMGAGLGGTCSAAFSAGYASEGQVVDANFARIAADLGIEGLLIFGFLIYFAGRAIWAREDRIGWGMAIGCVLLVCVGTNTLDSFYVSHCFWLCLGLMEASKLRQTSKQPAQNAIKPAKVTSLRPAMLPVS